jgi:cell division protein FtsL
VALIIALMGLLYLTQLTRVSSFSYELSQIDERKAELVAERDDLKVENARLEAQSRIKNSSVAANMTEPASTDYMTN